MKILKVIGEVGKWTLTVGVPLIGLLNVFAPVHGKNDKIDFAFFCVIAALPEIICVIVIVWATEYLIKKRRLFRGLFTLPSAIMRSRRNWRRVITALAVTIGLACVIGACLQVEPYLRARRRFYLYLFKPAYEQLTEREHLFASLTWQMEKAPNSAERLLTFPERPDSSALGARVRGFAGINVYCTKLADLGDSYRQKASVDHRLAVDYYCELLSLAPLRRIVRDRLTSLRADVLAQEPEIRALYQFVRKGEDDDALTAFRRVKGYLFENAIATGLDGRENAPGSNRLAPELKSYILAFPDAERLIASVRKSWRLDLIDRLVEQSEAFERIVSLKPRNWTDLGRVLLASNFPAYSRAVFNSLKGLRRLGREEEKLRIEAMVRSADTKGVIQNAAVKRVRAACREYSLRYGADDDIRLWAASVLPAGKATEVLDLLAPLGVIPKHQADAVFRLRIEALSVLNNFPSAHVEALNWVHYDNKSLNALMALGICESKLQSGMRLETILDVVTALSKNTISLNQADYDELRMVEEFLDAAAEKIATKETSLSAAQKTEVSLCLQRLVQWLEMEMTDYRDLAQRFIKIGETVDPTSPAFKWMAVRGLTRNPVFLWSLKNEGPQSTNQAMVILNMNPEDFPLEFRYRVLDAQRRVANASPNKNLPAPRALSPSSSQDSDSEKPPVIDSAEPWRQARIYEHPREMVFDLGFELYAAPSLASQKINEVRKKTSVTVSGYIDVSSVRFYLTDWSLERFRSGHKDGSYLKPIELNVASLGPSQYPGLKPLPKNEEMNFPHGYQVFDGPSRQSHLIKPHEEGSCRIAAYLDTNEGRFYLSDYSFDRYRKGLPGFWWICEIESAP